MAQVVINIPDQYAVDVLNAFANHYDYDRNKLVEVVNDVEVAETKAAFAKRMIIVKIKQIVKLYKVNEATLLPAQQAIDESDLIELT